ncbi:unnamed protein product, partial [Ectocarpus sp. 12 AP-2014]
YVILGYGVAGRAALAALLERDPMAKVLVVDAHADASLNAPNFPKDSGGGGGGGGIPSARNSTRDTQESVRNSTGESGKVQATAASPRKQEAVAFGRCLVALGSRPRPPPPGFIDPAARGHVTLLGSREGAGREELKREVAAGRAVTIVGSSWQALELACWIQE